MKNYVGELVKAYYQLLNGNITYEGEPVNVYNVAVDSTDRFHYIQLRPESETDASNKSSFVTSPVIIADILTLHDGGIDAEVVENIDNQMRELLFPTRQGTIIDLDDYQVLNIRVESSSYLEGFNGTKHEHRKITRFSNRIVQK